MPETTPLSLRKHITIFGNTNAGKSTLFNMLLEQDLAIVSNQAGTTTDPVTKAMELIGFGPVAITDTAGLGDDTVLGEKRRQKTLHALMKTDFAIYCADALAFSRADYEKAQKQFLQFEISHLLVFTKCDAASDDTLAALQKQFPGAFFFSGTKEGADALKAVLVSELRKMGDSEPALLEGMAKAGDTVVLVAPIDSAAPKGRLILPQVQMIRDCLDQGVKCMVVKDTELCEALAELAKVDLVITDSQAFAYVGSVVPSDVRLTSFSILMARQKGDILGFVEGAKAAKTLRDGANILIAEGCTHNKTHEDIGTVKIPNLLRAKAGKDFRFTHYCGADFPENLSGFDLVVHCGGCMLNRKTMLSRQLVCKAAGVPMTNYGILIAALTGVLDRCCYE